MKIYIVDRIEETFAVCEDRNRALYNLPLADIPCPIKVGDCLNIFDDGTITVDNERTRVSRERVISLMNSAFEE